MDLVLLIGQSNAKGCGNPIQALNLLGIEIAENIGVYYNEGKIPELRETDDLEQARRFLTMIEEAE